MSLTVPDNRENNNPNIEEFAIDKGFNLTTINGFQIKNCNTLLDSFSIKLTEEEKENIKKEILDFYKEKPNNSKYFYHKQFCVKNDYKTYNCDFLCVIKKIDDEKADIKYGMKEIEKANTIKLKNVKESYKKKCCES